jgi:hypothetical protein
VETGGQAAALIGMGWGPPERLAHLVRDGLAMRVTCKCGHTADLNPADLRSTIYKRHNDWWCYLEDVPRYLRCGQCRSKSFSYELVPQAPRERDDP